jgi:hypothetical protein
MVMLLFLLLNLDLPIPRQETVKPADELGVSV